jgi:site-specific DNA recombinase
VPEEVRRRQATLRGVRASLARQQERLLDAYLAEALDLATFERRRQTLREREEELVARERELTVQSERLVELAGVIRSTLQVCERLRAGLRQASPEERRQLIELLIDRVVVTDGEVEIRYVIPTTDASTQTRFCQRYTQKLWISAGVRSAAYPPGC